MTRYTPQWVQDGDYAAAEDRRLIGALWPSEAVTGMKASASTGMTVNIAAGNAVVAVPNGSVLCGSTAVEAVVISAAPTNAGYQRIDLIVAQVRATELDSGPDNDWLFQVVKGTGAPAGSEVAPAEPARAVSIATVTIPYGAVTITDAMITDVRPRRLDQPFNSAWGIIDSKSITTAVTGISARADVPGLSITFTAVANRQYRVSVFISQMQQITAQGTNMAYICDGNNNVLNQARSTAIPASQGSPLAMFHLPAGSPGSRTYKVRAEATAGTVSVGGNGTSWIMVEDVGPVPGAAGTLLDELRDALPDADVTPA